MKVSMRLRRMHPGRVTNRRVLLLWMLRDSSKHGNARNFVPGVFLAVSQARQELLCPMAGNPIITSGFVCPMTCNPSLVTGGWKVPVSRSFDILAVVFMPFGAYPYVMR